MPVPRFLIIAYNQWWLSDTLWVKCTTDVPVHLFLRWTDKREWMHLHAETIRGATLMKDPKYCFVEWQEVEQEEAGDTLEHTIPFQFWHV